MKRFFREICKAFFDKKFLWWEVVLVVAIVQSVTIGIDKHIGTLCYNKTHKNILNYNEIAVSNSVCYRCGIKIKPIDGDIGWHAYPGGTPYSIIELDGKLDAAKRECRDKITDAVTEFWNKYPRDRSNVATNLETFVKSATEGLDTPSEDEKIRELEKKVHDQKICYPVYTPTPEEAVLWDLQMRRRATDIISNYCANVCTNYEADGEKLYPGDKLVLEILEKRKDEWVKSHGTNTEHKCSFGTNCVLNPWVPHE